MTRRKTGHGQGGTGTAGDFGDINPFVLALTNWGWYLREYPGCDIYLADLNADGYVDFDNPFVALLSGGQ